MNRPLEIPNSYIKWGEPGDNRFIKDNRTICPKCGASIIRRVSKGTYYFTHCNRVWLK